MTYRGEELYGATNNHKRVDFVTRMIIIEVCRRKFEG